MPRHRRADNQYYAFNEDLYASYVSPNAGRPGEGPGYGPTYYYDFAAAQHPGYSCNSYYGGLHYFPPHQQGPVTPWNVIPMTAPVYLPPEMPVTATGSLARSTFSPDAPEFVSRQQPTTTVPQNEESAVSSNETKRKKKKRNKKKKTDDKLQSDVVPAENTPAAPMELKPVVSVHFQSNDKKDITSKPDEGKQYSILVRNATGNRLIRPSPGRTAFETKDPWPVLGKTNATTERALADSSAPKLQASFADKLKHANPFLDWRDQRTGKVDTFPLAEVPAEKELDPPVTDDDDGFIPVTRKKGSNKAITPTKERVAEVVNVKPVLDEAELAKRKADRERKKMREKEKKKRFREEKLLAQKLMPKSQKIGLITPAVMEKFLNSTTSSKSTIGRKVAESNRPPVFRMDDETLFPSLGGGHDSEWETTEIQVVQPNKPAVVVAVGTSSSVVQTATQADSSTSKEISSAPPAAPAKNVKRSDPIQFDLMALITKKSNKKMPNTKADASNKQKKTRQGVVANVLDRSAPVLSRGKIRNKKRKLSEIRKALLAAKAKKKLQAMASDSAAAPPPVRPHVLHSKKFREYCDQMLTDTIDKLARDMLYHLRTFQDRAYKKDPIKGRMKKRLVAGLREVTKQVERRRIKIIFLTPDIQRCPETGGLDEAIQHLLELARRADLPVVYALSRRKMGRVLCKKVPVSCCGILNYQATEETWKKLTEEVGRAREEYQLKLRHLGLITDSPIDEAGTQEAESAPTVVAVKEPARETDALMQLMKLSLLDR